MKRSEYKTARLWVYENLGCAACICERCAEGDTSAQEQFKDFPGWDPEEPEKVEAPPAKQDAEPEWFEWTDSQGVVCRCSLSGKPRAGIDNQEADEFRPGGWPAAFIDAIRQIVRERDGLQHELLQTRGFYSHALRGNEMLRAEVSRLRETVAVNQQELIERQANESRLRAEVSQLKGEVQMAEAKAKDALVEIDRLHAKEKLAQANRMEAEAKLRGEIEKWKQLALNPFSREEWRYEFAGLIFANSAWESGIVMPQAAVGAADALLEALEAGAEGEVVEEGDRGSSRAPEAEEDPFEPGQAYPVPGCRCSNCRD